MISGPVSKKNSESDGNNNLGQTIGMDSILINLFHLKKCLIGCAIDQDNDNTTLNVQ